VWRKFLSKGKGWEKNNDNSQRCDLTGCLLSIGSLGRGVAVGGEQVMVGERSGAGKWSVPLGKVD